MAEARRLVRIGIGVLLIGIGFVIAILAFRGNIYALIIFFTPGIFFLTFIPGVVFIMLETPRVRKCALIRLIKFSKYLRHVPLARKHILAFRRYIYHKTKLRKHKNGLVKP